jgi:di/tricarboxylate transporter
MKFQLSRIDFSSRWSELSVAIVFILMIVLWVTKDFSGTPGWDIIFQDKYISDGTVAILCGILPLILPNANPLQGESFLKNRKKRIFFDVIQADWTYEPIVRWNNLAKHMPWGALILLGAGLTVASAFHVCLFSKSK